MYLALAAVNPRLEFDTAVANPLTESNVSARSTQGIPAKSTVRSPTKIAAEGIRKHFYLDGRWLLVLDNVSIAASEGEFVSIIGPSGCGKSTLFNVFSGLERADAGRVLVDGQDVTGRLGYVGYMPQKDLLLPWKSVLDNTTIGLELLGVPKRKARAEAASYFPLFGLEGFERHYPATLSGGMRQRAALLRTVLSRRDILLLDEPFGALDSLTRSSMQEWLLHIWDTLGKTIIFVTHDVDEALYLSDRVYVMRGRPGHIQQVLDVPFERPRNYDIVTTETFADLKRELLLRLKPRGNNEERTS
jgi:ABC-type nitrate/sulfonate/bicarbonate transport system ATPase subunit